LLARTREAIGGEVRSIEDAVAAIVADVRVRGDVAVRQYTSAFDGAELDSLRVTEEAIEAATRRVSPTTIAALQVAGERIRRFHERARRSSWLDFEDDSVLGQLIQPIESVGVYAPGGRAPYPSTVLMAAIPARVAGVSRVVMVTPPGRDGHVADVLLAAARIAQVDDVFRIGGAQAISALAHGTESVPRVDKIVGPGNLFVVVAKRLLYGQVGIDGLPGPTECLIVADESANPAFLAADFIAQAEHDPLAFPVLIVTNETIADATLMEAARLLERAERREIIEQSLAARGAIVVMDSVDEGIRLSNEFAPEHLALCVRNAFERLGQVRNAGGVFLGELSAESIGDYTAGPSHIMPTGGTARFSSPLNLDDFYKVTSVFSFGRSTLERVGPPAMELAHAEGLHAHAAAVEARLMEPRGG
jgi:histidinol dehydrogenase